MKIASVKEIRELDRRAEEEFNIPPEILMENAGNAVFYVIEKEIGVKGKTFTVFAGTGNNGGDGFVVARKLASTGAKVCLLLIGDEGKLKGIAKKNYERLNGFSIERYNVKFFDRITEMNIYKSDAIVDAIFGIGISREITGIYKEIIHGINISGKKVISVDIPSGVNGDTGEIMGVAVKADYTVTFGLPKRGEFLYPGAEYVGKLYVSHISYPQALYESKETKVQLNVPIRIEERKKDTYKDDYGKALFVSFEKNYLGSPMFCSSAFLKAGGGLSYLATPESIAPLIAVKASEVVVVPLRETKEKTISLKNLDELLRFAQKMDIVSIGSSIALNEETQQFTEEFIKRVDKPLLIDGDAITAIAKNREILKERKAETIITSHIGELARLIGKEIKDIKVNRIEYLMNAVKKLNATIVLKGAFTLIGTKSGEVFINTSGNPGMATAGSGDVLTGTIAAMYGIGNSIEGAARIGVFIHGLSGDLKAKEKGMEGITATDILEGLPEAIKYYKENFNAIRETNYGRTYII